MGEHSGKLSNVAVGISEHLLEEVAFCLSLKLGVIWVFGGTQEGHPGWRECEIDPSITVLNYRGLEKTCPSLQPRRAPFKNTQQTIKTAKLDEKNPHFPIPPSPELEENRPDPKQDWFKNKIRTKNWYITFPHTLVNRGHIRTMSIMVGT